MLVVGIVATSAYREEHILRHEARRDTGDVAGYDVTFRGVEPAAGPNYREDVGRFDVTRGGTTVITRSSRRSASTTAPPQPTTEAGIHASWRGDLYLVLGDAQTGGGYAVRAYFNPLVRFIWLGALSCSSAAASRSPTAGSRRRAGRARRAPAAVPAE